MLAISSTAAKAINGLTTKQELPDDAGVRISSDPSHTGELRMDLVDGPAEMDQLVDEQGAHVFLDADVAPRLDDKILDAQMIEGGELRFTVTDVHD